MLPENIRDKYDGKMSSLYAIIEEQLLMYLPNGDPVSSDDEDDDDEDDVTSRNSKGSKNLVKYEEDDMDEDDEDDEEEPAPKKKSSVKGVFKKMRNKEVPF